jgi:signal transduction histidine kinase/ligand-binding sensor domain-containing protein
MRLGAGVHTRKSGKKKKENPVAPSAGIVTYSESIDRPARAKQNREVGSRSRNPNQNPRHWGLHRLAQLAARFPGLVCFRKIHLYGFIAGCLPVLALGEGSAIGPRQFLVQNWTRENGLPGNSVTSVAQTPDGYLWVGTFTGLARFDGVRFIDVNLEEIPGITDEAVTGLQTDRQGNLWIGMLDGHLIRRGANGFESCLLPPSHQTADRYIQRVVEDKAGGYWVLNYEGGISRLMGNQFNQIADSRENSSLISDSDGTVRFSTADKVMVWDGGSLGCEWDETREPGFRPEVLASGRSGGFWVAGNGHVRRFEKGTVLETRATSAAKQTASGLLEDRDGNVWLSRYGSGVMMIPRAGKPSVVSTVEGMPSDFVRCMFEDAEGNIWVGLEGKGLVRIRQAVFESYGRAQGMSDETVLCLCEGDENEIWIGTNGDGIYRIKNGKIRHWGVNEGLENLFVWSLLHDHTGRIWAGTWGGGLFRMEDEQFARVPLGEAGAEVVLALREDRQGRVWLGQRVGERRIDTIEYGRRIAHAVPGKLPRLDIRSINETADGSLWFGTVEEGLLRLKNGVFTRCGEQTRLAGPTISTLHVDDDGKLWAGAAGKGLMLQEGDGLTEVTFARALLDDALNQITDDGRGYLWCGLKSGVVRIKKSELSGLAHGDRVELKWDRFSKADGLPSNEITGPGCRTHDGRIWFGTIAGLAVVDPRRAPIQAPRIPVVIESVFLGGKRALGETPAGETRLLKIPPGSGAVDINYTALSFVAPERVRFSYQLAGLEETAVEAGSARSVRYGYLPPGNYEFHVSARNEGGAWNEAEAQLALVVMPRYWQTLWFRLFAGAGSLAIVVGIARWVVTRRLERRMIALEQAHALEAERSRIARDLHDDLGTSLTEINFLSAMAGNASSSGADVKASLESINEKSVGLVKALDEIVWAVNPENDSLGNLVNYLCLFAQDYLKPAAMQCRLDVPPGLPDFPLDAEQRHTLYLLVKEALANAAKHSGATEVWFRVLLENHRLRLTLEDNGKGFDPGTLKSGRNGLKNIETRMRRLGGTGAVRSGNGQGTRVELELPISNGKYIDE